MNTVTTQVADGLLTSREVAAFLGVSPRTIFSLTADGELVCVRFGRNKRYDVADIRAFIDRSKT